MTRCTAYALSRDLLQNKTAMTRIWSWHSGKTTGNLLGNLRYPVLLVLSLWKAPKSAPHGDKSRKWNVSKQKRTAVTPNLLGATVENDWKPYSSSLFASEAVERVSH